jgi:hypothetical protein
MCWLLVVAGRVVCVLAVVAVLAVCLAKAFFCPLVHIPSRLVLVLLA